MKIGCLIIFLVLFCTSVNSLKVAFLILGSTSDLGWNYNILQAVLDMRTRFPGVEIVYQESVTPDTCVTAANTQLTNGADMIIFPTGSFEACAKTIAAANPTKSFVVQNSGALFPELPNLAVDAKGGVFQSRYLVGYLAGADKKINTVCFMAPKTYGSLRRWANAILIGMRNLSSTDHLYIGLTADFNHPPSEEKVMAHFDDIDCDIVIQHQDSLYPQLLAESYGILGVGWGSDMSQFIGDNVVTSIVTDWRLVFSYYIQKKIDGTFISERFSETLSPVSNSVPPNQALYLTPFSKKAKNPARKKADAIRKPLSTGEINPFCGAYIQSVFGTPCVAESVLIANYLPEITPADIFDGTV